MIGDWPTGRRGALYSRAFYPGPAPPRANTTGCPAWKKIAVSGHDMVDEERLGVEKKPVGRRVGRSWEAVRLRRRREEGVKKVKNKLPGGIDKKIPARFFHQIQLGWTARTGGGGRKPDRTRGGSRTYIYIHAARGWVYRHGGGSYGGGHRVGTS